jgi:hypothetical protein
MVGVLRISDSQRTKKNQLLLQVVAVVVFSLGGMCGSSWLINRPKPFASCEADQEDVNVSNPYLQQMLEMMLIRSSNHQAKLFEQKGALSTFFPSRMRFQVRTASAGGVLLNDQFAYLHIWKSGGTTIEKQAKARQYRTGKFKNHKLVTFVRDPVDHFLSGWAECGLRWYTKARKRELEEMVKANSYDARIRTYLSQVRDAAKSSSRQIVCVAHSYPQANFILNKDGELRNNLKVIGDLREISGVLEMVGFPYDDSKNLGRDASQSKLKTTYYPSRKDLISNVTMLEICQFVAIDYFLFDFEPPEACRAAILIDHS